MRRCALASFLALLSLAPACQGGEGSAGRGILVIAVDAWRAEALAAAAELGAETRRLRRFLNQSVQFSSAWSTAPEMLPGHTTLLTGCDPRVGLRPLELFGDPKEARWEWFLSPAVPRVAEAFLAGGWRTAAFVDDVRLAGRAGLDQGFQLFEDPGKALRYRGQFDPYGVDGVARRFHEWLKELDESEQWFAYLQLADLDRMWRVLNQEFGALPEGHSGADDPLLPVADASASFFAISRQRFDGTARSLREYQAYYALAVERLEQKLGGLFTLIDTLGWSQHTTIVLVGSHGFGFGESGIVLDSGTLSDVDLHVPLLFHSPDAERVAGGRVIDALVSTADVAETLLDIAGLPRVAGMHGESLLSLLQGDAEPVREYAFASSGMVAGWATIDARYCFERVTFDVGPLSLASSFYGIERPTRDEVVALRSTVIERLHDRVLDARAGHLGLGASDPTAIERLRAAGEQWNDLVFRARLVLHDPAGIVRPRPPEEIAYLLEQRMLGQLERIDVEEGGE